MKNKIFPVSVALICFIVSFGSPLSGIAAEWPKVETAVTGGIKYLNGGFGIEERDSMPTDFPLKIVFATDRGHYLSGVDVTILNSSGNTVFELRADDGPWLLVDLKAGRYSLEAVHNGHKKSIPSFTVPAWGTKTVLVSWKVSEVDMGLE